MTAPAGGVPTQLDALTAALDALTKRVVALEAALAAHEQNGAMHRPTRPDSWRRWPVVVPAP